MTGLDTCRECHAYLVPAHVWRAMDRWERAHQKRAGNKRYFMHGWCHDCYMGQRAVSTVWEPPVEACSRCSARIILSPADAADHRCPSNPGGVPHYCRPCTEYLNFAA